MMSGPSNKTLMGALKIALLTLLVVSTATLADGSTTVRVHGSEGVAELGLAPRLDLDYGSYRWLTLTAADLDRLTAAGVPYSVQSNAYTVRVPGHAFDPLVDGEPQLTPAWRAAPSQQGGLRLVQLNGPATDRWMADLEASGAKVLQYYPFQTYLVWANGSQSEDLARLPQVRWQGTFQPGYKLGDHLDLSRLPQRSVVIYVDGGNPSATVGALSGLGTVVSDGKAQPDGALRRAVVALDAAGVQAAAHFPEVLWIGPQIPGFQVEDEMASQIVAGNHPGGTPDTGYFNHLTGLGYDGAGVTWAVADTGVDLDHPDLAARIVGGFSVDGASCSSPPGTDCNDGGHGTHVAGILGGDASGGFTDADGFLYGLGVAPGVSLFAMSIFGGDLALEELSRQAVLGGASGSNNSWTTGEGIANGYQDSERTYDFIVRDGDFTTAVKEPHTVVFSAGNSGPGPMTLTAPKEAKNVIVAAATQNFRVSGNIDNMYSRSSRGPAVDGRVVPTVAAPGQSVASTRNDLGGSLCANAINNTNDLYAFCTGTSMAAPHVSGSLAVAYEWWNDVYGVDPSPAMAKALLVISAVDMAGNTDAIPNADEGWGRVQLTDLVEPGVPRVYEDQAHVFDDSGETWSFQTVAADPSEPLKVTLVWTDAPGALGANPALVNDLDLQVTVGGNTYLGNDFVGGVSVDGGVVDTLNNLENVFVPSAPGAVTVTVRATVIAGDGLPSSGDGTDQDFALICQNCRSDVLFVSGFETGDTTAWSASVP